MNAPIVSVIVPMYNAAGTVAHSLASLQSQSLTDWEAVVVDDGSTDASSAIVRTIAGDDPRVRLLHQENRGVSAARNAATTECRGEYLYWLDPDDACLAGGLETLIRAAETNGLGAAVGHHDVVDTRGETLHEYRLKPRLLGPLELVEGCSSRCGSHVVRRALTLGVDGAPLLWDESLSLWEDRDYWMRLAERGVRWGVIDRVVTNYLIRPIEGVGEASLSKRAHEMLHSGAGVLRAVFRRHEGEPGFEAQRLREVLGQHGLHSASRAAAISGDGIGAARALLAVTGSNEWGDQQLVDAARFGVLYGRGLSPSESTADRFWIGGLDALWATLGIGVDRRAALWSKFVCSTVCPGVIAAASLDALLGEGGCGSGVVVVGFGQQGRSVVREAVRRGVPVRVRDDAGAPEAVAQGVGVDPMSDPVPEGWGVLVSLLQPGSLRQRFAGQGVVFAQDALHRLSAESSWDPAATALVARVGPCEVVGHSSPC